MGLTLATVLLAVPLTAWLGGMLKQTPQLRTARFPSAPCGMFPNSWYSKTIAAAARRGFFKPACGD